MPTRTVFQHGSWALSTAAVARAAAAVLLMGGLSRGGKVLACDYCAQPKFQAVRLPYGQERVGMYLFLPATNSSVQEFVANLNATNWDTWLGQFHRAAEVRLQVPLLRLECGYELRPTLAALGMPSALNPDQANFGGLSTKRLFISQVVQKRFLEVNEQGAEAAAATMLATEKCAAVAPALSFQVDRPFVLVIHDRHTGAILFLGVIADPR